MAYVKRTDEEIIRALDDALSKKTVNADEVALRTGETSYTYNEILAECRKKSEFGMKFLNSIRECALCSNRDPLDWLSHYSK